MHALRLFDRLHALFEIRSEHLLNDTIDEVWVRGCPFACIGVHGEIVEKAQDCRKVVLWQSFVVESRLFASLICEEGIEMLGGDLSCLVFLETSRLVLKSSYLISEWDVDWWRG